MLVCSVLIGLRHSDEPAVYDKILSRNPIKNLQSSNKQNDTSIRRASAREMEFYGTSTLFAVLIARLAHKIHFRASTQTKLLATLLSPIDVSNRNTSDRAEKKWKIFIKLKLAGGKIFVLTFRYSVINKLLAICSVSVSIGLFLVIRISGCHNNWFIESRCSFDTHPMCK